MADPNPAGPGQFSSRPGGRLNRAGISPVGMAVSCAALVLSAVALPAGGQPVGAETPTIRLVGPLAVKEMTEALAAEFVKARGAVKLDYLRIDIPAMAAGTLVGGRDLVLTLGKVREKDLGYTRERWRQLSPEEHVLGARAVAVAVHPRSPLDCLTMAQLQSIFSGSAAKWQVFGGPAKSIRRYGLQMTDPLAGLFHEMVLPVGKCGMILRKKGSSEVLAALAGDPDGIAFLDAVAAASAGDRVNVVSLGEGASSVSPNAQTIKDGSYGLAQTLVLYVSPNASPRAREFAEFLRAGKGDAVCRTHGFMPTLRAVRADVQGAFEKLYGPDISRVTATAAPADDIALAGTILRSARTMKLTPELLAAMCEAAYDLAAGAAGGRTVAFEALDVLSEKVPAQRFDCALRRAALCEAAYKATQLPSEGDRLAETLMKAADLGTSAGRYVGAADAWRRALAVAEEVNSPSLTVLKSRQPAFIARVESVQEARELGVKLRANPQDVASRSRMLLLQLIELDNPAEAVRFLGAAADEAVRTNAPLAAEPLEKVSEEAALKLAE